MKKIYWRVFVYFSVVLMVFTVMIGLMFTRFNQTNIVGTYKQQLGDLASGVAKRTRQAVKNRETGTFSDYMQAMEDFSSQQDIDVWIVTNPNSDTPLREEYTNIDFQSVNLPADTQEILDSAFEGTRKNYTDYDDIYKTNMLHMAVPIRSSSGNVIGAVVVSGPMEMKRNIIIQYEKYMLVCIAIGLLLAVLLAFYFSNQLVRPIIRIKETALILAAGKYGQKTGVIRRDELGSLADSMDVLSDRLLETEKYRQDVEQHRRDFFSNVSHELRTPIAVVKGYADALADGYVQEAAKQEEYLQRIRSECGSMERLVSDLLILSRMQNPDYQLNLEIINVIAVAQDVMRSMRILMKEKNLEGNVTYEDECSLMDGDYDRIRQLFVILLQNAVKYSDEGTSIDVHVGRKDGKISASVKDIGSVIPREEWENIFEKFYRASNHGGQEGSGLGLVVASHIVKRHKGEIHVFSDEKRGTCFTVIFPETSEKIS